MAAPKSRKVFMKIEPVKGPRLVAINSSSLQWWWPLVITASFSVSGKPSRYEKTIFKVTKKTWQNANIVSLYQLLVRKLISCLIRTHKPTTFLFILLKNTQFLWFVFFQRSKVEIVTAHGNCIKNYTLSEV